MTLSFDNARALPASSHNTLKSMTYFEDEIIQLGNNVIAQPLDTAPACPADLQTVTSSSTPAVQAGDLYVNTVVLYPQIICNLRRQADNAKTPEAGFKQTLSDDDLDYIKHHLNQEVTLFIHGFDVAKGACAKQVKDIDIVEQLAAPYDPNLPNRATNKVAEPVYNTSNSTIYRGIDFLKVHYPVLNDPSIILGADIMSDAVNGSEAYRDLIHMENNINVATNQFHYNDYRKYGRLIGVFWSGDVGAMNYMASEPIADTAGEDLKKLLQQLIRKGVTINIIAHSMGNRVLLKALDSLNQPEAINHIFMWDAAVPNTALSNQAASDTSIGKKSAFVNAAATCKKITVLFSKDDKILQDWYSAANDTYTIVEEHPDLAVKVLDPNVIAPLPKKGQTYAYVADAMGYSGPDGETVKQLGSKLILAPVIQNGQPQSTMGKINKSVEENTLDAMKTHSYMIDPTPEIMDNVYKVFIVNKKQGLTKFSQYDSSQFSDKEAPSNASISQS